MRLKEKIAIITGGGRGIGRGIAMKMAGEGAGIVIAQRDEESAQKTAEDIITNGGDAYVVPTDISQPAAVDALMQQTLARCGHIDILVNNAGIAGTSSHFLDLSLERWQRVLEVNLTGVYLCSRAAAQRMVDQQIQGRIINIGSVNSLIAQKCAAAYVAAKGGVLMLTKAMAVDLSEYGILVNCIAPGSIRVERNAEYFDSGPIHSSLAKGIPLGHPGEPEDIGHTATFLASDEAKFITGAVVVVDGGFSSYFRLD